MTDPRVRTYPVPKPKNPSGPEFSAFTSIVIILAIVAASFFFSLVFLAQLRRDFRAIFVYKQGTAIILEKRLIEHEGDPDTYRAEFVFQYDVNGKSYSKRGYDGNNLSTSVRAKYDEILERYEIGKSYPCWYDPDDPHEAVLVRALSFSCLFLPIPLLIVFCVVYLAWSVVRDLIAGPQAEAVPKKEKESCSPDFVFRTGKTLPFALSQEGAGRGYFIFLSLLFGYWFLWFIDALRLLPFALRHGLLGSGVVGEWAVLLGIGYMLIARLISEGRVAARLGKVDIEISAPALYPGESFECFLRLHYRKPPQSVKLSLVCQEEATYMEGTARRIETETIFTGLVYDSAAASGAAVPTTHRARIRFPARGMHAFKSDHNEIQWNLEVLVTYAGLEPVKRTFPLPVRPNGALA